MLRHSIGVAAIAAIIAGGATPASAAGTLTKAWVSSAGADGTSCGPIATPCRTFTGALAVIAAGGEIDVKDPGAYGPGPILINKAVSIVNDGVGTAGVQAGAGVNAFTIQAGVNDGVYLRGLTIDGGGVGANGIELDSAGALDVIDCTIRHFSVTSAFTTGNGVLIAPTSGYMAVTLVDVVASDNGYSGVQYRPPSGNATFDATFTKILANHNSVGINVGAGAATGALAVTISDSVTSENSASGVYFNGNGAGSVLTLRNLVSTQNGVGVGAYPGAGDMVFFSKTTLSANSQYGLYNNATVYSLGDNLISGNHADVFNSSGLSTADAYK